MEGLHRDTVIKLYISVSSNHVRKDQNPCDIVKQRKLDEIEGNSKGNSLQAQWANHNDT